MKRQPKTLARTLEYIGCRSPGEFGLFWDPDGTMPWKEFHWALQEDPALRFVRQANLRELELLGLEMSFRLEGNLLRLSPAVVQTLYPATVHVPERLYFGMRSKNVVATQNIGLRPSGRRFVPLCTDRELALRIARRREPEPILLEIFARRALEEGIIFFKAGAGLFLAESVPAELVLFPKLRREITERIAEGVQKSREKPKGPLTPGSYTVQPHHLAGTTGPAAEKAAKKSGKGERTNWKKGSRRERHKREV